MSKAQKQSYLEQVVSGNTNTVAAKVLHFIMNNPESDFTDVMNALHLKSHSATARIAELHDAGLIKISKEIRIAGHKHSMYVFVQEPSEQKKIKLERRIEKFNNWVKLGENKFDFFMNDQTRETILKNILIK